MALRPTATAVASGRRTFVASAMSHQAASLNDLKNSFWDALSGKAPKTSSKKPQKPKDGAASSDPSESRPDQAVRGRAFARRRPSLFATPSASSSPTSAQSGEGATTGSGSKHASSNAADKRRATPRRNAPIAQSSVAQSRYPERFIFETYQPPSLAEMDFVKGNPWTRNLANLRPAPAGQLLTEEKAQLIREFIGGDYASHVASLPKEVEAKLDAKQQKVLQGAMRVLNANGSYKVQDKMAVVATVVEGVTAGKVKRGDVLKD